MRRSTQLLTTLLLGLACTSTWADDAKEVSAADCFAAGFRANDADAVAACYAEDAILWIPGGPMAKGRQAIHDGLAGYFAAFTVESFDYAVIDGRTVGDDRVQWGTYSITKVAKAGGPEETITGRFTDVSRRIDGKWQYVVDHPSDDPPPAAAATP